MLARFRLVVALGLLICAVLTANAYATITVANTSDSGPGSLRQAIADAVSGETILLPAGDYLLTSGELAIAKTLTIAGQNAADARVSATGAFRVFNTSGASSDITLSGLTISGGKPVPIAGVTKGGGVLDSAASLSLTHVVVEGNRADADAVPPGGSGGIAEGGGVDNESGALTITDSIFAGNVASAVGGSEHAGGIAEGGGLSSSGRLILESTTFDGNSAVAHGGAGPSKSSQSGGIAEGGGAIVFAVAPVDVSSSTFTANAVDASAGPGGSGGIGDGGGAWMISNEPPVSIANITVAANLVQALPNGIADGGGLYIGANSPGGITLTNATIVANTIEGDPSVGGGGDAFLGGENTKVLNTVISAGVSSTTAEQNCAGKPASLGHNLDSRDECNFHAAGDQVDKDPLLGPLMDNGGPTQTFAPLAGSPLVNAGDNGACPLFDQRAVVRPQVLTCDIGAVELAPPTVTTGSATGITTGSATLAGTLNPNASASVAHFDYGTSTAYGSTTSAQSVPTGLADVPLSASLAGLTAGTVYHFRLVASNAAGQAVLGADQTFTTLPVPPPSVSIDRISGLKVTPSAFFAAPTGASVARNVHPRKPRKTGATVSYSGSQAATTTFTVTAVSVGRLSGHRCVKLTHSNRSRRRCTLLTPLRGSFTHVDSAGAVSFHITGRLGAQTLRTGSYILQALPRNAAGTGPAARASFRVKR